MLNKLLLVLPHQFTHYFSLSLSLTCVLCQLPECLCQLELGLYLGPQLHHPPPALRVLPPHTLYDGGGEGHASTTLTLLISTEDGFPSTGCPSRKGDLCF